MTITHDTMTVETVLQAVRQLSPSILDRAGEIEAGRRVPLDLIDELRAAGCFRLVRPATHGGLEASIADAMRALESLARADASVAWTVMIGAGSWIDLAHLPRETFDALYATNPDAITAGVFNPTASITPEDGGYRVTGRWSFASGCEHADVIFGNGVRRHRRRDAAAARRRVRPGRGHHRGHLVGVRAVRHREPPLPRRRRRSSPPSAPTTRWAASRASTR